MTQEKSLIDKKIDLIKLRHNDKYVFMFKKAENHPILLKNVWLELAAELGSDYKSVKTSYNQLLSKFRLEDDNSVKTGSSPSRWRYWEIFSSTFPKSKTTKMNNVIELGHKESILNIDLDCSESTNKSEIITLEKITRGKEEVKNIKVLKEKAYESIIKLNEQEINEKY